MATMNQRWQGELDWHGTNSRNLTNTSYSQNFLSLKKKIFIQCIVPTMIYASETWIITKKLESKIRSAQLQMERKMLGVRWKE